MAGQTTPRWWHGSWPSAQGHERIPVGIVNPQPNSARGHMGMCLSESVSGAFPVYRSHHTFTAPTAVTGRDEMEEVSRMAASYEDIMPTFQHKASDVAASSYGHVDQLQCGTTDFSIPTDNTIAFFRLPSTSQNFRMPGPDISGNIARTSGTTWNLEPNMEYYRVDHLPSSFDAYDNGSTGVLNPTFIRRYWEASKSCTDIEQPSSTPEDEPSVPSGTAGLEHSATYEYVPMYQNVEADIPDDLMAAIEATVRGLEINNEYVPLMNSAGARGGANNVQPQPEEGAASSQGVLQVPRNENGPMTVSVAEPSTARSHQGPGLYQCEICYTSFRWAGNLTQHLRLHMGENPKQCGVCRKVFARKSHRDTHLRVHSGEKPHTCGICDKTFTRKLSLTYHLRTHSGERPYKCAICARSFAVPSSRRRHERLHAL